jgi:hypothetical protein
MCEDTYDLEGRRWRCHGRARKKSSGADGEIASTVTDGGDTGRRGWGRLPGDASDARLLAIAADRWD